MKILFITAGLTSARAAANSYQEALMEELVRRGHRVACLCTAGVSLRLGTSWSRDQGAPYVRYTVFNAGVYPAIYSQGGVGSRHPLRDVHSSSNLREAILQICRAEDPEIVSIQSLFGLPFELVDELREDGIPVVFTAHDYFSVCPTAHLFLFEERPCRLSAAELVCHTCCKNAPSYKGFWLSYHLDKFAQTVESKSVRTGIWRLRNVVKRLDQLPLLKRSSAEAYRTRRREAVRFLKRLCLLHCISQRQEHVLQEICGPLDNIRVLPLMPPTVTSLRPIERAGGANEKISFVALNAGGLHKGANLLKNAFRNLAQNPEKYELHVYGNYPDPAQIPSVFYHGPYGAADLDRIASTADFCIVPSVCDETLGFVGLEMLSRGVPVIASSRAGLSEFIVSGRNGYIFDPSDPNRLTLLVRSLIESPAARSLRTSGICLPSEIKRFGDHVSDFELLLDSARSRKLRSGEQNSLHQAHCR